MSLYDGIISREKARSSAPFDAVCFVPVRKDSLNGVLQGYLLVEKPRRVVAVVVSFGAKPLQIDLVDERSDLLICAYLGSRSGQNTLTV